MGKYANTEVVESDQTLKKLHAKHKEERLRKRINMLLYLKAKSFKTRQELANALRVGKRTLERWVHIYENQGIAELIVPITRKKKSSFITEQIHEALSARLNNPKDAFTSYKEIQHWLDKEHDVQIKYNNLYYYLKQHFRTKLKVPRKSHIKKDDRAVAFFKNG